MPVTRHRELDVVELLAPSGRWPAGTVGTVLESFDRDAMVEVDEALDLDGIVIVPHEALAAWRDPATRAAS
jgi:hypothetical protein